MKYISNGWNWFYLACGTIAWLVSFYKFNIFWYWWASVIGIMFISIAKEVLDEVCKRTGSKWMRFVGFDPAGYDVRDNLMTLIGIGIGIAITLI